MKQCLILLILVSFSACKSPNNDDKKETNSILLTTEQIKDAQISTEKIISKKFPKLIECSGYIDVPPPNKACITAPINGFVKSIFFYPGNFVNKGDVLAVFQHSDYIKLQEEFLEVKNKLNYYKAEFKRQAELTMENATSIKTYQKAQVDFRSNEVKYLSLKAQLSFVGLNPENINEENIQSSINIYAPISGYITKIDANIGEYIDSQKSVYEIADISTLYLYLKINEKDIFYLEPGQKVIFNTNIENREYSAGIKFIEQTLDKDDKTIKIHAKIDSVDNFLKPGMFVQSKLLYNYESVNVINEQAIIKGKKCSFIIIKEKNTFTKSCIETGVSYNGFVELLNPSEHITNSNIVVNGKDIIYSKLN